MNDPCVRRDDPRTAERCAAVAAPASPPRARALAGRTIPWLAVGVALGAVAFAPGVRQMVDRWMAGDGYYAHGPLVPLVSLWIVWRERKTFAAIPRRSSATGLALVAASILLLAFGLVARINAAQQLALIGTIAGTALLVFGFRVVRRAWFAIAFLIFMVPLPGFIISNLTFAMKMAAARFAVTAIELVGIPVVLEGSTIHLAATSVTVDNVCAGLKTSIALLAIATVFAYLERSRVRAVLTLALALPIAIVANVVRILVLCWLAVIGSPAAHEGPLHDATGLGVYAVALVLLMAIRSIPVGSRTAEGGRADGVEGEGAAEGGGGPPILATVPPSLFRLSAFVLLLGLGAAAALTYGAVGPSRTQRTKQIPTEIGAWKGTDVPISKDAYATLETEDVLLRSYIREEGPVPVELYVVHGADSTFRLMHPPEMCFAGSGFMVRDQGKAVLRLRCGREIEANRALFDARGETLLVYYWFRQGGRDMSGYMDVRLATLLRQLRRAVLEGSMVRISTPVLRGQLAESEARIAAFAAEALGPALEKLP